MIPPPARRRAAVAQVSAAAQTGCETSLSIGRMPDPQSRIRRYQQRAEECIELAGGLGDGLLRAQYLRVAETYLRLVEIELRGLEDGIAIGGRGMPRRPAFDGDT